ncbi:hypothetical protein GYH30_056091 [Glycine max]|uniref:Serine decarboxylase n=1 Tax=Glycine max TaxID=3847 RepID=A0A0R0ELZ8_SOYBN|nr:hypothetical protein GYH30_056091 [Glycine max]
MTMAFISAVHATELLPNVVRGAKVTTRREKYENNNSHMNLAITQCSGDTQANLASATAYCVETLNQYSLCNLGYPTNRDFNCDAIKPLLHFHLNNADIGHGHVDTSHFEKVNEMLIYLSVSVCVLNWFANLWEIKKNEYWRYATTGGTEGNLHGILVGREQLRDGILYTSQDSHYSIFKIARIKLTSGEIDCANLRNLVLAHKDKPAIINLNIGTTMKGAIDDLDLVIQTLEGCGFTRDRFYIHCDGALFGMMLPFVKQTLRITFKKPIGSVTISGHKIYINALSKDVEIIASRDTTITGSRCQHAPIFLWYALKKRGLIGLQDEVQKCIMKARYLQNRLGDAGIGTILNKFSNIVIFERPLDHDFTHGQLQPLCIANDIGSRNCACSMHR